MTTTTTSAGVQVVKPTVAGHLHDYWGRIRGGDIGSLPAILGLIVLCLIFGIARPTFFSAVNFANLFSQGAPRRCVHCANAAPTVPTRRAIGGARQVDEARRRHS